MFPIFVAQEMGFYEEEGLDVTLNYSKGSSDAARQLAAGNVDWGIFSAAATMQAVQRGFPLKAIMQVYYPDTFDIVVPEDSPIQSMMDAKGKIIGVSDLAGGEVPMVRASIVESGLSEGTDVKLVIAGEGDPTTVRSFEADRIQAYAGAKRDLLLLPAQGIATRSITPEVIASFPGDALSVRAETFEADPETLVKFTRATLKGWAWGMTHSDETFALLKDKYASASLGDNPVAEPFWELVKTYYTAPDSVEMHGTFLPAGWQTYMDYLQLGEGEQKALAGPVDLEALLIDDIVLQAWEGVEIEKP
jgi:NitT/TauT family transport system substrate-binding protein